MSHCYQLPAHTRKSNNRPSAILCLQKLKRVPTKMDYVTGWLVVQHVGLARVPCPSTEYGTLSHTPTLPHPHIPTLPHSRTHTQWGICISFRNLLLFFTSTWVYKLCMNAFSSVYMLRDDAGLAVGFVAGYVQILKMKRANFIVGQRLLTSIVLWTCLAANKVSSRPFWRIGYISWRGNNAKVVGFFFVLWNKWLQLKTVGSVESLYLASKRKRITSSFSIILLIKKKNYNHNFYRWLMCFEMDSDEWFDLEPQFAAY